MERSFQKDDATPEKAPAGTRARVIGAASELFATRGFAGTSISAIRDASGLLPSSIYWEFGSKEGILAAVLEESAENWHRQAGESARRAFEQSRQTGRHPLEAYFANLAEELTERPDFLRLLLLLALERREADPATIDAVRRVRMRATAALARAFRTGGLVDAEMSDNAVEELARIALAFADGAFIAAQIDPGVADLRRMFAIFYAGMAAALRVEGGGIIRQQGGPQT
jgi:AcrR family transcriptional regulator